MTEESNEQGWTVAEIPDAENRPYVLKWTLTPTQNEDGEKVLRFAVEGSSGTLGAVELPKEPTLLRQFRDTAYAGDVAHLREQGGDESVGENWNRVVNPIAVTQGQPAYWLRRAPEHDPDEHDLHAFEWELRDYEGAEGYAATPIGRVWGHYLSMFGDAFEEVASELEDKSLF